MCWVGFQQLSAWKGSVICALISPEQREKEGKLSLFLFLWVCNKASCSKSFNLSRNEGYISVFWLQRTISPSFFLSFSSRTHIFTRAHTHTHTPNHCWNRACLVNWELVELPLLCLVLSFCLCICVKVSRSRRAASSKDWEVRKTSQTCRGRKKGSNRFFQGHDSHTWAETHAFETLSEVLAELHVRSRC